MLKNLLISYKRIRQYFCIWLAAGKYPMRSLAHFYIVDIQEKQFDPTEEGHQPVWVDKFEVENLCPLPYHQQAIEYYLNLTPKK